MSESVQNSEQFTKASEAAERSAIALANFYAAISAQARAASAEIGSWRNP